MVEPAQSPTARPAAAPSLVPAVIRPMEGSDDDFIVSSFVRSLWTGGENRINLLLHAHLKRDLFYPEQTAYLRRILLGAEDVRLTETDFTAAQRLRVNRLLQNSQVLVAKPPGDDFLVLGFAMGRLTEEALVLHYVYVRHPYRRDGLASAMLARLADGRRQIVATHRTVGWEDLATGLRGSYRLSYNPALAEEL